MVGSLAILDCSRTRIWACAPSEIGGKGNGVNRESIYGHNDGGGGGGGGGWICTTRKPCRRRYEGGL